MVCKHAYSDETITEDGSSTCIYCGEAEPKEINHLPEFKKLQKENEVLREQLEIIAHVNHMEGKELKEFWVAINNLVSNEIDQEKFCGQ